LVLRAGGAVRVGGFRVERAGGAARGRDPRGEQRARHRDRSPRREAHPRRPPGAAACAAAVRDDDAGGVRGADSHLGGRRALLLRLEDADGAVGYGEAAPFEPYDGVPLEAVAAALRSGAARSTNGSPPQARAAEEMARLDLEARREGRPVGEPGAEAIAVNRTLAGGPPEEVAARAAAGVREGFACFKVKVGLPDDAERVAAVREAIGSWPALRIDANGAWTVDEAIAAIDALSRHDLQLVEQPCRTLEEMAEVRRSVPVPLAAD